MHNFYFIVTEYNRKKNLCMCDKRSHYTTPIHWCVGKVPLEHERSHLDHLAMLLTVVNNQSPLLDHTLDHGIFCLVPDGLIVVMVCKDCKAIALVCIVGRAIFTHQARIHQLTCLTTSHCPCMVVFVQLLPLLTLRTTKAATGVCPHRELVASDTSDSLNDYIRVLYRRHNRWGRARVVATEHHKLVTH